MKFYDGPIELAFPPVQPILISFDYTGARHYRFGALFASILCPVSNAMHAVRAPTAISDATTERRLYYINISATPPAVRRRQVMARQRYEMIIEPRFSISLTAMHQNSAIESEFKMPRALISTGNVISRKPL